MTNLTNESFSNNNSNDSTIFFQEQIFSFVWQLTYIALILLFNFVVLFIFCFKIGCNSYSNLCFISITLCDLITGLISVPGNFMWEHSFIYLLDPAVIYFFLTVSYCQTTISLYTLALLSFHRLNHLISSSYNLINSEKVTRKKLIGVVAIWLVVYVAFILMMISFVHVNYFDFEYFDINPPVYAIALISFFYYMLPTILVFVAASLTMCLLIQKKRKFPSLSSSSPIANDVHPRKLTTTNIVNKSNNSTHLRDARAIVCLLVIVLATLLTQIFYILIWPFFKSGLFSLQLYEASNWIGYSNSLLNPIILVLFHDRVKFNFKLLFFLTKQSTNSEC